MATYATRLLNLTLYRHEFMARGRCQYRQEGDEMKHARTESKTGQENAYDRKAGATLLSASTITGDEVCNLKDEKLGSIQDLMLDTQTGKVRYAVLSSGGFLGMGDRLFAVPWSAFKVDTENKRFILDVNVERLKAAPGFDKDEWPNMADDSWNSSVESYYSKQQEFPRL
jgi:sporulation protein YlmC with PRC-barrel domain